MRGVALAIVGAGPAGLSAAIAASKCGLRPVVIDENPAPGGQIYRQLPREFQVERPQALGITYEKGQRLLARAYDANIELKLGTTVWGLFDNQVLGLESEGKAESLQCGALVLATGGYDRAIPFPGWTLPGVMTLGGAQTLVKSQRMLPGKKIILSGVRAVPAAGYVAVSGGGSNHSSGIGGHKALRLAFERGLIMGPMGPVPGGVGLLKTVVEGSGGGEIWTSGYRGLGQGQSRGGGYCISRR